jgi:hypothetical protein
MSVFLSFIGGAMKTHGSYVFLFLMLMPVACTRTEDSKSAAAQLSRSATIRDIMDSMVDPSADFMFESVREIWDETGIHKIAPQTDEDWAMVRRHALVLLEAPNLVTMEGRKVAGAGEKAEYPEAELQPEEIQKLIDADRPSFIRRAKRLQDSAAAALEAIDAKDEDALFKSLVSIDHACENCHLHYWYPNDKRAHEAAKEEGLVID